MFYLSAYPPVCNAISPVCGSYILSRWPKGRLLDVGLVHLLARNVNFHTDLLSPESFFFS